MWYASANRDERSVPNSYEFIIDQADVKKISIVWSWYSSLYLGVFDRIIMMHF